MNFQRSTNTQQQDYQTKFTNGVYQPYRSARIGRSDNGDSGNDALKQQQKKQYGEYLRMQMQMKKQNTDQPQFDKKEKLQHQFEIAYEQQNLNSQAIQQKESEIFPKIQSFSNQQNSQNQYTNQGQQGYYLQQQPKSYMNQQQQQKIERNGLEFGNNTEITTKAGRNLLQMENEDANTVQQRQKNKQMMNQALMEQIETKKRKKEDDIRQQKQYEQIEDERIKNEQLQMQEFSKREEEKKKRDLEEMNKQNQQLLDQRSKDKEDQQFMQPQSQQQYNSARKNSTTPNNNVVTNQNLQQITFNQISKEFIQEEKDKIGLDPKQSLADFYRQKDNIETKQQFDQQIRKNNQIQLQQQLYQNETGSNFRRIAQSNILQQNYENAVPFYNNHNFASNKLSDNVVPQLEELKQQVQNQQKYFQQQLNSAKQEAFYAMEERNRAEKELKQMQEIVQQQQYFKDPNLIYNRNAPIITQPGLFQQKQMYNALLEIQNQLRPTSNLQQPQNQANYMLPPRSHSQNTQIVNTQKRNQLIQNLDIYNNNFKESVGLKSLASDSKMIPLELLENFNETLTFSKLNAFDNMDKKLGYNNNIKLTNEQQTKKIWDVPSINSDLEKDIDNLMYNKNQKKEDEYKLNNDDLLKMYVEEQKQKQIALVNQQQLQRKKWQSNEEKVKDQNLKSNWSILGNEIKQNGQIQDLHQNKEIIKQVNVNDNNKKSNIINDQILNNEEKIVKIENIKENLEEKFTNNKSQVIKNEEVNNKENQQVKDDEIVEEIAIKDEQIINQQNKDQDDKLHNENEQKNKDFINYNNEEIKEDFEQLKMHDQQQEQENQEKESKIKDQVQANKPNQFDNQPTTSQNNKDQDDLYAQKKELLKESDEDLNKLDQLISEFLTKPDDNNQKESNN